MEAREDKTLQPIMSMRGGTRHFKVGRGQLLHALDGIDLDIMPGEVVGLAGESGCGKSTCGRALLGIEKLDAGTVYYRGQDMTTLSHAQLRKLRREVQMVFQDPFASLDPRMTVADTVAEGIDAHHLAAHHSERMRMVHELLAMVGLGSEHASRYPHEFSGGQRQRVGIARAMAPHPKFLVLDEPISALDVSIQAQVVNLLSDLRATHGLAMLFISHDLSMLRYISDRVVVMYLGMIVEQGSAAEVFSNPLHPYTKMLLASVPIPHPEAEAERRKAQLRAAGEVPSPINPQPGCRFASRCPFATERCRRETPTLTIYQQNSGDEVLMRQLGEDALAVQQPGGDHLTAQQKSSGSSVFAQAFDAKLAAADRRAHKVACWLFEEKN